MFINDDDRTKFCGLVTRAVRKEAIVCRAFCLMPTHYHLLVEVEQDTLQATMKTLNWYYARWFNAVHARSGHFVGRRYFCELVETDEHMLELLRYLARNPVKAGLCARPSDWYWGSYRGCAGYDGDFPFVDSSRLRAYFAAGGIDIDGAVRHFVGDELVTKS